MSAIRTSVEWIFGDIVYIEILSNYFKLYVIQAKAKYRPMCSLTYLNPNHLVRVAKIS